MQVMHGHLGGYVQGGDPATYYPDLWKWAVERYNAQWVVDVGCGEGHSLKYFRDVLGCSVLGIEGLPQEDKDITVFDFTQGKCKLNHAADLVWCCEFLEHIEEKFLVNVAPVLAAASVVMITHAFPGQGGYHHVNCQPPEYWIGFFAALGLALDSADSQASRTEAAKNTNAYNHYTRSGMIFKRKR
jgi:hypothetical protein